MRTSNKCTKCGSLAIGHVSRRYERPGYRDDDLPTQMLGVLGSRRIGVGPLEAYVCTECGYVETYVIAPATVQFEQIRGFRWVNEPDPQRGPFR
jgi:hypothetical protein